MVTPLTTAASSALTAAASPLPKGPVMRTLQGVVLSAGLASKTARVRIIDQVYYQRFQKHYPQTREVLCHDPASSLRTGDVIALQPGWRTSKRKRHVVTAIIAPFGEPIEARPSVPSAEEREAENEVKREAKRARRKEREEEVRVRAREKRERKREMEELERRTGELAAQRAKKEAARRRELGEKWPTKVVKKKAKLMDEVRKMVMEEKAARKAEMEAERKRKEEAMKVHRLD